MDYDELIRQGKVKRVFRAKRKLTMPDLVSHITQRAAGKERLSVHFPSPQYTTDNAARIAAAGFLHLDRGERAGPDLNADPNLKL